MRTQLLKQPIITEKSLHLANTFNVYTFKVARDANKNQIKEAVELVYGVKVIAITTTSSYRVRKRTGKKRMPVMIAPYKVARVKLEKGQSIDAFDIGGQA